MKPAIEIYLDPYGKVTVNGTIEDDHINLQLLLKSAEAVVARMGQARVGGSPSDVAHALHLVKPGRG